MSALAAMWSPLLFGFALFLSSALLFVVQPMVGRTLLPHLGGNPVAWNACLVFFQATLLAGYVYASLLHRYRGLRWQPWLHMMLMMVAVTLCFAGIFGERFLVELTPRLTRLEDWPIVTTLCLLIVVMGVPFFALSAVSPLVHRWFAHVDHPRASDPYFLMVASNLGGLAALVIYPVMIEPVAPLAAQWMSWKLAVTALGVMLFLTALCAWRSPRNPELEPAPPPTDADAPLVPTLIGRGPATVTRRLYWLFAAALPVGLLMGVTDFLTLDVAPTPILWTLPLALYLIAFCQAFARFELLAYGNLAVKLIWQILLGAAMAFVLCILGVVLMNVNEFRRDDDVMMMFAWCWFFAMLMLVPFTWVWVLQPLSVLVLVFVQGNLLTRGGLQPGLLLIYLGSFYLSVRLCLGMLAEDRPAAPALTTYFSWIGIGGLVGGLFQLFLAPLIFRRDHMEYSLLAALACTLRAGWAPHGLSDWLLCLALFPKKKDDPASASPWPTWIARGFDVVLGMAAAVFVGVVLLLRFRVRNMADPLLSDFPLVLALAGASFLFLRPLRFGLALTAVVALCWIGQDVHRREATWIVQRRTPFGILRVEERKQVIPWVGNMGDGKPLPSRLTQRTLLHGTTHHGACITEPAELLRYPTTYYHRKGPVGLVMSNMEAFKPPPGLNPREPGDWLRRNRDSTKEDVRVAASLIGMMANPGLIAPATTFWAEPPYACVGLGAGTLFTYARPYQWVDAYELDPAIIELSTNTPAGAKTPVFHYFQSAQQRGALARIIPGDARRSLTKARCESFYHVIFIDATSSNSIPSHLLTQEALDLYFQKLAPDGVVCFHTSNRHLDLTSVLEQTARRLNLVTETLAFKPSADDPLCFSSEWIVIGRTKADVTLWTKDAAGHHRDIVRNDQKNFQLRFSPKLVWTDQRASVLSAVRPGDPWSMIVYGMLIVILFFGIFLGMIEIVFAMIPRPGR